MKYGLRWHHTALRVKDPKISVEFYTKNFGMQLVEKITNDNRSTYFLVVPRIERPPHEASIESLWNSNETFLALCHLHGTEKDDDFKVNHGNKEPHRGFGHIAFNVGDVEAACDKLESLGVLFQKKPNEGRMKGLAFALDPDGYWIEIVKRSRQGQSIEEPMNLSQTMIRVKDPKKSLKFYLGILGLKLVREMPMSDFTNYFLVCLPSNEQVPDPKSDEASDFCMGLYPPVLELTHNHGTESQEAFKYHSGNEPPKGFSHIGFLVDDLGTVRSALEAEHVQFTESPGGTLLASDPDGYLVQLFQKEGEICGAT